MTDIMTTVFIEQLLSSPGSAKEAKHLFNKKLTSIYLSSHETYYEIEKESRVTARLKLRRVRF